MRRIALLLLLVCLSPGRILAGTEQPIDSLKRSVAKAVNDTNKVNTILALAKEYLSSSPELAGTYSLEAKNLSQKIGFRRGMAFSYKSMGMASYGQGKYLETMEFWQQSLKLFEEIGDKNGAANILGNIGAVYFNQGDDANALEYYLKALRIAEESHDTLRMATVMINIGAVYANKTASYDQALNYYLKALPFGEQLGDNYIIGTSAVNIGEIYLAREELDTALKYFNISLKAYQGTENLPYTLNYIGKVYARMAEFDKAISFQRQALDFSNMLNSKLDIAQSLISLANTYREMGNVKLALEHYEKARVIAFEIGSAYDLKRSYEGLALSYSSLGNFKEAFKYQTLFTNIKDTLYNIETDKKMSGLLFNYEIEKKQGQIDLLQKDKALQESDLRRQKIIRNASFGGMAMVLLFLVVAMTQKRKISLEKKRSEELLLNILPEETAEELKKTGTAKAKSFDMVSVMFTDFKNFTQASEKLSPEELVNEINSCFSAFDRIIAKYGIEKIKTIGDSYMCAAGLPAPNPNHASEILKAGLEMQEFIAENIRQRQIKGEIFFELRLGVHTGPVVAGIVGIKKFAYDIWGDTVNTASRIESSGAPGRVNISGDTYQLIKDEFRCTYRGKVDAKNKGQIDMYFVEELLTTN